jgi:inosine-uridine nucleoside N-ribohydrolase
VARAVVIDCDPGTDDAIALLLALGSPELDVRLVSVVGGNVGLQRTVANACAIVSLSRRAVPVVAGADRALLGPFFGAEHVHSDNGIGGVWLPDGGPSAPGIAADAIRAVLRQSAVSSVTLVGIGPATNLALVLATEPALAGAVAEIVLMTGAWGEGNVTPGAEFNAWNDPEALAVVLACGRPITLVTLDLTAQALVTPARLVGLRAEAGGACIRAARDILASVPPADRLKDGYPLHDPCAVAWLLTPERFSHRPVHVAVDCGYGPNRGRTIIDRRRNSEPPNARLLETLDADALFALLGERIAVLP